LNDADKNKQYVEKDSVQLNKPKTAKQLIMQKVSPGFAVHTTFRQKILIPTRCTRSSIPG